MPVQINFADVPDGPKEGTHAVVIKACKEATSQSGNPCIKVEYMVTSGEAEGQKIFATYSLQPNALFSLRSFLKALEYDTEDNMDFECDDVIGKEILVEGAPGDFGFSIKKHHQSELY